MGQRRKMYQSRNRCRDGLVQGYLRHTADHPKDSLHETQKDLDLAGLPSFSVAQDSLKKREAVRHGFPLSSGRSGKRLQPVFKAIAPKGEKQESSLSDTEKYILPAVDEFIGYSRDILDKMMLE